MSSKRTVMLLDALLAGAEGNERDALAALYQSAFSQIKEYASLRDLLNNSLFVGDRGNELYTLGATTLEKGMTHSGDYENTMANMTYVIEHAEKLREETTQFIHSFRVDPQTLYVISKRDNQVLKAFLTEFVNLFCYYVAVLYGADMVSEFRFDPEQSGPDMLRSVNAGVSSVLNGLKRREKPCAWSICRQTFGGGNVVQYAGFVLQYTKPNLLQLQQDHIQKAPFLFFPKEGHNELCSGVGQFTTLSAAKGAALLSGTSGVVTRLDDRAFDNLSLDYNNLDLQSVEPVFHESDGESPKGIRQMSDLRKSRGCL